MFARVAGIQYRRKKMLIQANVIQMPFKDNCIDCVVTDPPYGLEFMGVAWDTMRENGKPRQRNEMGDYCAKASRAERNAGLERMASKQRDEGRKEGNPGGDNPRNRGVKKVQNYHPTVKPLALIEYLVKLGSRPGHIILDCFVGSGTTMLACDKLNRTGIGLDLSFTYLSEIAKPRQEIPLQRVLMCTE